jgi:glycosyltransferase involved in cell wall biosynthesis
VNVAQRSFLPVRTRPAARRTYGVLSTFPPTPCGLATFSAALALGLEANGADVGVVRLADGATSSDPRVMAEMDNGVAASLREATAALNGCSTVIVQHEYGLYGGTDGDEILQILRALTVPAIVVAHTVLLDPTEHQKQVLEAICETASAVVVMAETARQRLCSRFDVDASKVTMIPHGATLASPDYRPDRSGRPVLLTWGLLGRGKGIEWAIDAMEDLRDLRPRPRYVVAGRTHPKVIASEGEAYREMLLARSWAKGVAPSVSFDSAYRDLPSLTRLVQDATVVVLPYDSQDQVTSGVLVDALAAGRPVVATAFPHAVELLSSGAGIVVPHRDATALGEALRRVLTRPAVAASMAREAARLAPSFAWPAVARQYAVLADNLFAGGPNLNQGAERTLSLISTSQYGRHPVGVAP